MPYQEPILHNLTLVFDLAWRGNILDHTFLDFRYSLKKKLLFLLFVIKVKDADKSWLSVLFIIVR